MVVSHHHLLITTLLSFLGVMLAATSKTPCSASIITIITITPQVQAVPYWVDDESVRPSMLLSAPVARSGASTSAAAAAGAGNGSHVAVEVAEADVSVYSY
jgi:hypothetical protein